MRAKGITILKFEGKTDCFPNEREPTTWELLRGERRFSNIYGKRSVNETEPWQTEPEGYRVPFQNLPFPLSRYAIVPARCETLPVESRYSIDHNARRKKERERSNVEFREGALFISRNEFRGAKKSMDVRWREYPSYLFPFPLSLSLSARSSILPFYLARSSPMRLPPPMSAGSMDGRYLFFVTRNCDPVFLEGSANYAHHRPPPTVSKTVVLKKKKGKKKKEKKEKEYLFFARTATTYVAREREDVERKAKKQREQITALRLCSFQQFTPSLFFFPFFPSPPSDHIAPF